MKTCPKCKTEYTDDKKFCKSCGGQLLSTKETDPKFSAKKMVLEEKLKTDPLNISLLSEFAQLLIENILYDEAILILYKILAIEENNLKAQRYLFHCLNAKGKTKEAAEIGYKLVDQIPDNTDLLLEVALLAMGKEDNTRALNYFDRIIKNEPKQKDVWKYKAAILYKMDDKAAAYIAWNSVYNIDPKDIDASLYLGIEASKKGEYGRAKELIESVIERIEDKTQKQFLGLVYLAKSCANLKLDEKSISDLYSKINAIMKPDWLNLEVKIVLSEIVLLLGQKALEKKDFSLALSYFENVGEYGDIKRSREGSALTYYKMSEEYYDKKDLVNAEHYLNESLKLDPTNSEVKEKHVEILDKINANKRKKKKKNIIVLTVIALCSIAAFFIVRTIQSLNENDLWNESKKTNTFQSYSDYILLYPNGKYVNEANSNKEKVSFFIDKRDGKKYRIVLIGKQIWMAENLNFETSTGSWLYKNGDDSEERYGRLYNWETAILVCPKGWRLPTKADFETLAAVVNNDGNMLKAIGQGSADGAGTNTSGFSALLAGNHNDDGYLNSLGYSAGFWSSTGDTYFYYSLNLYSYDSSINFYNCNKKYGYSVRCLKD